MPLIDILPREVTSSIEPQNETCDRNDGHIHCQQCNVCGIRRRVYIKIKNGVEYWFCRKCALDSQLFTRWDLKLKDTLRSTAYDK